MKRWQKALLGTAAGAALLAGGAYHFRTDLVLSLVRWRTAVVARAAAWPT